MSTIDQTATGVDAFVPMPVTPPPARDATVRARVRPGVVVAGILLFVYVLAAVAPSVLASGDPNAINLPDALQPPSAAHLFGTDANGRDLYTRVVYGTRESLLIGLGATALSTIIASILGITAGLGPRWADAVVSRITEVIFAFPVIVLGLLLVAVFKPSAWTMIVAVGVWSSPGYARLIRGQVLAIRGSGYVESARALGHPRATIVRRHILPNAFRPLVVVATLGISQAIVWASGLSFLGLGIAPPSPEWGALLNAGRDYIQTAWWLEIAPGAVIVVFAVTVTSLGRALQQRLEGAGR